MSVRQDDQRPARNVSRAALFLILSRDDDLSPRRRERILKWMRASSDNVRDLLDVESFVQELDRLKLVDRTAQLSSPRTRARGVKPISRRAILIGGAAAVALPVGLFISRVRFRGAPIRHLTLEDGSVAHILRGSNFSVDFSDQTRLIHLPYGEAVFDVAKDPNRPFIVRTKLSDTIAVGTRFGIVSNSRDTTTIVSEGVVRVVVPAGAEPTYGTSVRAGEELRVLQGASQPESVMSVNAERKISWSAGWLEFNGQTAGEAVSTFTRFTDVRIEMKQSELSSSRVIYGRFEFDKPRSFAFAIGNAVGAQVFWDPASNVFYIGDHPRKRL
jgi:transmembrane sensor